MFGYLAMQGGDFYVSFAKIICGVFGLFGVMGGITFLLSAREEVFDDIYALTPGVRPTFGHTVIAVCMLVLVAAMGLFIGGSIGASLGSLIVQYHVSGILGVVAILAIVAVETYKGRHWLRRVFDLSAKIDRDYKDICEGRE